MAEIAVIVESLWELDEDELAAQIGSHAQAIEDDAAGLGTRGIDPGSLDSIDVGFATKGAIDLKLLEGGRRLFDRANPLVYDLMCKPLGNVANTQKILDEAISENYTKAAGMLAPTLISGLGLAPAIATLVATLIIKKIANYAATGICETWQQNLPKPAAS